MSALTAPDPNKHIIAVCTGFNNSTWTAVTVPATMPMARSFSINNNDGANALSVCTDGAGTAVVTVPANGQYLVVLSSQKELRSGFAAGEIVCYVKGAGSVPVSAWVR